MNRVEQLLATSLVGLASIFGVAGCATFPSPPSRTVLTGDAERRVDVPLCERDIVQLRQPNPFGVRAVSCDYILRTGEIPMSDFGFYNDSIDWGKDDSFTRALKTIEAGALAKIRDSAPLQDLLRKDTWTQADREQWEEEVSNIIGREIFAVPGLNAYRSHTEIFGHALNVLSKDIDNNTQNCEFDCKAMSFVRGCVLQRIENAQLPSNGPAHEFKRAMNYFVVAGGVCFDGEDKTGGHTFIFTPAGNVIEGTQKPDWGTDYKRSMTLHSFEDFVRGKPFVSTENDVYGGYQTDHAAAREAAAKEACADKTTYPRGELLACDHAQYCDGGEFIMVTSCMKRADKADYELKLFQKRDAGSPLEGYVLVARESATAAPGTKPPGLDGRYHDSLTGRNYRFSCDFGTGESRVAQAATDRQERGFYRHEGPFNPSVPAPS